MRKRRILVVVLSALMLINSGSISLAAESDSVVEYESTIEYELLTEYEALAEYELPTEYEALTDSELPDDAELPAESEVINLDDYVDEYLGYISDYELPALHRHSDSDDFEAFAITDNDSEDYFEYDNIDNTYNAENVSAAVFPSYYNAYEENILPTLTRQQGRGGACWAFAALGAIETELIKNEGGSRDIDLSEYHLAYYATHGYTDPKNCHGDDSIEFLGTNFLNMGGNQTLAYHLLSSNVGPVDESFAVYRDDCSTVLTADDGCGHNVAQLNMAIKIPTDDRDGIKEAILEYGSVATSIYALNNGERLKSIGGYYVGYNDATNAFYGKYGAVNHAVMIVGWDDNFSRENFIEECRPNGDGAWLVRNSWGGDGYGRKGYFWISYYDVSLSVASGMYVYDASFDVYDHVYSYIDDPLRTRIFRTNSFVGERQVYRIDGGETIKAIGFETYNTDMTATVKVTAGSETAESIVYTTYAGFYTAELDKVLDIKEQTEVTVSIYFQVASPDEEIGILWESNEDQESKYYGLSGQQALFTGKRNAIRSQLIGSSGSVTNILNDLIIKVYTEDTVVSDGFLIETANLTLDSDIGINLYVKAAGIYEGNTDFFTAEVKCGEKNFTYNLADCATHLGDNASIVYYKLTGRVAAKDMDVPIECHIKDGDGNIVKFIHSNMADKAGYSYSVNDYLKWFHKSDNSIIRDFADAMYVYGQYAASYFDKITIEEADSNIVATLGGEKSSEIFGKLAGKRAADFASGTVYGNAEGIIYLGTSLVLESKTILRQYYYLEKGRCIEDYDIEMPLNVVNTVVAPLGNGSLFFYDCEMSIRTLDEVYVVSINNGSLKVPCGVDIYIHNVLAADEKDSLDKNADDKGRSELAELMKSFWLFKKRMTAYVISCE